jgi:2-polyprenyl-3-methyl-5-hydroxy-6-metoxy-1,4-benzoquinol methylase
MRAGPESGPLSAVGEPKPGGYYAQTRANVIEELPLPLGRVLDVGCGEGGASEPLRARAAAWISGIEIMAEPAAKAAERYDEVEVGDALEALGRITGGPFDTILCYDVLEHLVDPAALVRRLRDVAAPGGHLHVSVPNARHYSLARDLVLRGTFGYAEWGHRDSTHLRWFTRSDLKRLLEGAGWRVVGTVPSALHRLRELELPVPARLVNGLGGEFFSRTWYVLARSPGGT